jgi:hypothetical protein
MGTHAKPRTTGRKAALGALAFGASLTGVGLIAAALDPSTAVLTATGEGDGGTTQLSGLSSPVSLDLTPAADSVTDLTSAPLPSTTGSPASASAGAGYSAQHDSADAVDWFTKPAKPSGTSSGSSSGGGTAAKPSGSTNPTTTTGSGGTGKTTTPVAGSGAPPTETSGITSAIQDATSTVTSVTSQVVPAVQNLVGQVPIVSTLVQDTGVTGTVSSLPVVGTLLGGSGDGQSTVNVPGLSTVAGLL